MVSTELMIAAIGAGLAAGVAGVGSGIGQGIAAAAGAGAVAEDEATFGKAIVFSVLPETQAIYGLLTAILIMVGVGLLGAVKAVTVGAALAALGAGLAVGLAGISGIGQGIAAASGIGAVLKDESLFGRAIVYAVLPETQAIYGLLVSIIIMVGSGLLGGAGGKVSLGAGLSAIGAGLAVGLAGTSGIGQGIAAASGIAGVLRKEELFGRLIVFSVLPETQAIYGLLTAILIVNFVGLLGGSASVSVGAGLAAIGAGLAVGLAGTSGIGQGIAAASGIKSLIEEEGVFGRAIVFSVLPETQAIYGLLVAILTLFSLLKPDLSLAAGLAALGMGLAVGIAGTSGIGQGIAAASGIAGVLRKEELFGRLIVFSVLPETQAIYGLLTAILAMFFLGSGKPTLAAGLAAVGAGLAVGFGGTSGIGQGIAAASGIRAMIERAELFVRGMVLSVLPETRAIYGLLVAILALFMMKSGSVGAGLALIGAGMAVGLVGVSGIGQGFTAATGASTLVKNEGFFGRAIIFSVLPETQAIYGLLTAILIMMFAGILGGSGANIGLGAGLAAVGAGLAVGLAGSSAIGQGISAAGGIGTSAEMEELFGRSVVFSILPETQSIYGLLIGILLAVFAMKAGSPVGAGLAALGAGLAVGIAGFSGIGQGIAAAAGIGALKQDPGSFGRSLIFSILPETRSIYGLLVAILVMVGLGLMGGAFSGNEAVGLAALGAGLAIGLAGLSGVGQGVTAATGISSVVKDPGMFGRSLLFSVFPETQAIYGLLIAILIMMFAGILGGPKNPALGVGLATLGAGLAVGMAGSSGIGQGISAAAGARATAEDPGNFGRSIVFSILPETQSIYGLLAGILALTPVLTGAGAHLAAAAGLIGIGAGLAVGIAGTSGIGQGIAAAGGTGALAERTEMFARSLILSILPETRSIYGLLIAILSMSLAGVLGGAGKVSIAVGFAAVAAGIAVGFSGLSGVGQGITAARGSASMVRREQVFGKSLVFSVLPETQAIYGLLTAILIVFAALAAS
ncbi:hypothetical protein [Methanopyrus sp. KOL6]|uniref:hypothetical protein n=1 Tax=Methanopyrus sp. KOL6 TaxID=1937004 RepID=UPI0018DFEE3B|nr:hypothetical protein [Methanopyrus sp. KOL6]